MHKYLCLFERKYIDSDWDGVDFAFVYADDHESAAKRFIKYLLDEDIESRIDESYWMYVSTSIGIPVVDAPKDSGKFKSNYQIPQDRGV